MSTITKKIIKWVFNTICVLIIFATIGLLLWRIFSMKVPKSFEKLTVNEKVATAYAENEQKLTLFYQEQGTFTKDTGNYGYFSAPHVTFIKEAAQVQVVFRYNNSTLKHLKEDYGLSEVPPRDGNYYDLTLSVMTDLTPENKDDNTGADNPNIKESRVHATSFESEDTLLYNYRKFIFDGVNIEETTLGVYLDIYYVEDVDYSRDAYGTLFLYDATLPVDYRELSKDDIKRITEFLN